MKKADFPVHGCGGDGRQFTGFTAYADDTATTEGFRLTGARQRPRRSCC